MKPKEVDEESTRVRESFRENTQLHHTHSYVVLLHTHAHTYSTRVEYIALLRTPQTTSKVFINE